MLRVGPRWPAWQRQWSCHSQAAILPHMFVCMVCVCCCTRCVIAGRRRPPVVEWQEKLLSIIRSLTDFDCRRLLCCTSVRQQSSSASMPQPHCRGLRLATYRPKARLLWNTDFKYNVNFKFLTLFTHFCFCCCDFSSHFYYALAFDFFLEHK